MGDWYVSKQAWIHIWYVSKPVPPCHGTPWWYVQTTQQPQKPHTQQTHVTFALKQWRCLSVLCWTYHARGVSVVSPKCPLPCIVHTSENTLWLTRASDWALAQGYTGSTLWHTVQTTCLSKEGPLPRILSGPRWLEARQSCQIASIAKAKGCVLCNGALSLSLSVSLSLCLSVSFSLSLSLSLSLMWSFGPELRTLFPLTAFKNARNPKFVQNLSQRFPSDCFLSFLSGGLKFGKICQNLSENYRFSNFDKFFQISVPLTGTPQNNRWDKFWTNLGFRAFLKAVRGEKGSQGQNLCQQTFLRLKALRAEADDPPEACPWRGTTFLELLCLFRRVTGLLEASALVSWGLLH